VFTQKAEQGAGPLFDIATHALDSLLYMMDNYKPKMVVGATYDKLKNKMNNANPFGNWDPETFDVEDSAFGFITMENGASIILECSWLLNTMEETGVKYLLCGTEAGADNFTGKLRVNTVKHNRLVVENPNMSAGGVAFFDGQKVSNTDLEQRNFIDAIQGKAELVNTPERGKVVTDILNAIKISAETGAPVYF
jgi:predicted dehydrogenase